MLRRGCEHFPVPAPRLGELAGAMLFRGGLEQSVDVRDNRDPCRSSERSLSMPKAYTNAPADNFGPMMATRLEKTLKRELRLDGRAFIVALSPQGLKITLKGKRKGQELRWSELVSGDAALAVALNASVGRFEAASAAAPPRKRAAPAPRGANRARAPRRPDGRSASKRR
jgi:hypothetical protein